MNKRTMITPQQVAADIAREYREDASRWTQGAFARRADGSDLLNPRNSEATCWCLRGAIDVRVTNPDRASMVYEAFDAALGFEWNGDDPEQKIFFVDWNDKHYRTVDEVIAFCDKVALAK